MAPVFLEDTSEWEYFHKKQRYIFTTAIYANFRCLKVRHWLPPWLRQAIAYLGEETKRRKAQLCAKDWKGASVRGPCDTVCTAGAGHTPPSANPWACFSHVSQLIKHSALHLFSQPSFKKNTSSNIFLWCKDTLEKCQREPLQVGGERTGVKPLEHFLG